MRRAIERLALTLAVVALAAGAASATEDRYTRDDFSVVRSDLRQLGGDFVESIDLLFEVGQTGKLFLGTTIGSVNVHTWSYDKIRLVVDKRVTAASPIDARRILGMFRIQAMHGKKGLEFTARARTKECARNLGVTFNVWIPKSYDLDVKTKSGDIDIPDMDGRFSAHTSDGKVSVDCDPEDVDIEVEDRTRDEAKPNTRDGVAPKAQDEPKPKAEGEARRERVPAPKEDGTSRP